MKTSLTPKEQLFVNEYVTNGYNGTKAYMKAYDTDNDNVAAVNACVLLKKEKIQDALEVEEGGFRQIARQHKADKVAIVKKLQEIIFGDFDGKTIISAINTLAKLTGDFAPEKKSVHVEDAIGDVDTKNMSPEQLEELKKTLLSQM
jgi:phage terminase small subunit